MRVQELFESQDKIEGLETSGDLFKQKFATTGFYNTEAKAIVKDKLAGRFAILQGLNYFGNKDIRDRHQSMSVDLGPYGHGFESKSSAQEYLKKSKKEDTAIKKRDKEKGTYDFEYKICKVEALDSEIQKMKALPQYQYISGINLSYAE